MLMATKDKVKEIKVKTLIGSKIDIHRRKKMKKKVERLHVRQKV